MSEAVAVQQETVTYYHWLGLKPDGSSYPSSEIVHINGGERVLGGNGIPMKAPMKEARFHGGIFTSDDPDTIKVLDKFCARPGSGYTKDYEEYLSHVLTASERLKRQAGQAVQATAANNEVLQENSRLKAKLAELEAKETKKGSRGE
jgi:hypothetical protein